MERGESQGEREARGGILARWALVPAVLGVGLLGVIALLAVVAVAAFGVMLLGGYLKITVVTVIGFFVTLLALMAASVLGPVVVIAGLLQVPTVVLAGSALGKTAKQGSGAGRGEVRRVRVIACVALGMGLFVAAVVGLGAWSYVQDQNSRQHTFDTKEFPQAVAKIVAYGEERGHDHFPAGLAAAALDGWDRSGFLQDLKREWPGPSLPIGATAATWRGYEPTVEAEVDYRYVGGDLPARSVLAWRASGIVILYSKRAYDGGRTVAFADGSSRFIKKGDLERVFHLSSLHREALGLPAVELDGPGPAGM